MHRRLGCHRGGPCPGREWRLHATVDLQPNRNILEGLGALDAALDGEGAQSAEDRTIVLETRIVTEDDLPLES